MTTMADLMKQVDKPQPQILRGDLVEGKIVLITDSEIFLDLGVKNEGVILKNQLSEARLENLKVGDKLTAFVINRDTPQGQIILSLEKEVSLSSRTRQNPQMVKKWQRAYSLLQSKSSLKAEVVEQNKGGIIVGIDGLRGFLPGSQLSLNSLNDEGNIVGSELLVKVSELDERNNKLIVSLDRLSAPPEDMEKLSQVGVGQTITGTVGGVFPFGLFLKLEGGVEGFVKVSDAAWEKAEDLTKVFKVGQEVEGKVVGKDEELRRVNISLKATLVDPFEKMSEDYQIDDVITGVVLEINSAGVKVDLKNGIEGFIPTDSIEVGSEYRAGQQTNFLVSGVDNQRRRINLSPFLTSTKGLMYK